MNKLIKELQKQANLSHKEAGKLSARVKRLREKDLAAYPVEAIPLPAKTGRVPKYPWHKLEIGESFFVSGKSANDMGGAISNNNTRKAPKKFTARTVNGGGRIWRIK